MYEKKYFPKKRYKYTLQFLKKHIPNSESILDLGEYNPFSKIMQDHGYSIKNTKGEDLDFDTSIIENSNATVITAFEILEHLLSPFTVLRAIKANRLVVSIPLRLWFSS
ncbi:MAG TPA: methyltransferase, partial [Mariniflexile sp.]